MSEEPLANPGPPPDSPLDPGDGNLAAKRPTPDVLPGGYTEHQDVVWEAEAADIARRRRFQEPDQPHEADAV
jgi:hypothetical protein